MKIKVGILGATGSVGQKFIQLLKDHPWFEISELAASEKSAGKKYKEAVNWFMTDPIPGNIQDFKVKLCKPGLDCKIVFSGLDASVAGEIEEDFAKAGYVVISNSRNHRFDPDVPLLIPEINSEHLKLLDTQNYSKDGCIITNPNCSTIGLSLALKPLLDQFGIEALHVVTLQALSGGGYPGVSSLDAIDNIVPFISGEEEKMESEPLKILGSYENGQIKEANFKISAQCNRVGVIDGHTEAVAIKLLKPAYEEQIIKLWKNFQGEPQKMNLPTAPVNPIHYFEESAYPQPRLHKNIDKGMAVSIGRLDKCPVLDFKFTLLSHNTVRGAKCLRLLSK